MHLGRLLPMSDWIWKRENLNILFSDVPFWIVRTGYQHELREIQNIENRKLDMLRNKHKPTHDAVMWYKENQSRFQGEVHLPLLLSVSTGTQRQWKWSWKYLKILQSMPYKSTLKIHPKRPIHLLTFTCFYLPVYLFDSFKYLYFKLSNAFIHYVILFIHYNEKLVM